MRKIFFFAMLQFFLLSCKTSNKITYQEDNQCNLYMFIGEKIEISKIPYKHHQRIKFIECEQGDTLYRRTYMDEEQYLAKYKVIRNIYNNLKTDFVTFYLTKPDYQNDKFSLIYLSKSANGFYYNPNNEYEKVLYKNYKFILENKKINLAEKRNKVNYLICKGY